MAGLYFLANAEAIFEEQSGAKMDISKKETEPIVADPPHVRHIKKLPNGDYHVIVSCADPSYPGRENGPMNTLMYETVTLPASTRSIERLNDPDFVAEAAAAWLESHGGKWFAANLSGYLEEILKG